MLAFLAQWTWLRSYPQDRNCFVSVGNDVSQLTKVTYGVHQGSVLTPSLFNLYMLPQGLIMQNKNTAYHCYADHTQLYTAQSPADCQAGYRSAVPVYWAVKDWVCQTFLQLNKDKTQIIAFGVKDDLVC